METDCDAMGIPNPDRVRTPLPAPIEQVEFSFKLKGIRQVAVHFKVKGNPNKARPYGYNGVIVKWLVSEKSADKSCPWPVSGKTENPRKAPVARFSLR